jgi:MYXO-CTERM domain-containing protein
MKYKHRMILPLAMIASLTLASSASAALAIVNGNFENTTGLTITNYEWYGGIATGWSGPTPAAPYSYRYGGGNVLANLELASVSTGTIQPLYQDIGTLDGTSNITLTFDYVGIVTSSPLNVAIYDGASFATVLGTATYTAGDYGSKSITVNNVAAATDIRIGFWQGTSGNAGLDNVAVSVTPVPEPSAALLGGLGMLCLLRRRR